VWPLLLAQVLPRPQLIFPSKTWFFGIYLNFQQQTSLKNQHLSQSESKSYQLNSIEFCSFKIFPTTPIGTFQFLQNFQLRINLIFSEKIIQYSRTFGLQTSCNQPMHPPPRELSKETKNMIWSIWVWWTSLVQTKQLKQTNNLPS